MARKPNSGGFGRGSSAERGQHPAWQRRAWQRRAGLRLLPDSRETPAHGSTQGAARLPVLVPILLPTTSIPEMPSPRPQLSNHLATLVFPRATVIAGKGRPARARGGTPMCRQGAGSTLAPAYPQQMALPVAEQRRSSLLVPSQPVPAILPGRWTEAPAVTHGCQAGAMEHMGVTARCQHTRCTLSPGQSTAGTHRRVWSLTSTVAAPGRAPQGAFWVGAPIPRAVPPLPFPDGGAEKAAREVSWVG